MSKISTYEVAPVPKLADKLIGTSVGGEIEDVTYNFTLQELLDVFLPVIPANNLQGVLDYGNTATQDINLFGTITTTNLDVTDTANFLDSYFVGETHIEGGLFDSTGSIGTAGQVLTSTGTSVDWVTLPPIFTPNLQQVLTEGNTSDIGIILDAGLEALDVDTDTATINTNITIDGTITDGDGSTGALGAVLSSIGTGVEWIALPSYSATSPLLFNSATGVFSIQQASGSQNGYLSSSDWTTFDGKQNAGNYITALTGEVTASGPGSATATISNAAVIGKVLTGFNPIAGTINASDSILTAFGKAQSQINALVGGVQYQGVWNANTNTPTLTSSVGTQGHYYVVNVAGTTNLNGITDWQVGDWAIFSESTWQKVDNTESVSSVNGFTGAVSLTTDNIPEGTTNLYFLNSRARLALSATSPLGYDNSTGVFSIQQANSTQNGYLSSTDWTTFNGKQNYLSGTGLVKSSAGTISYITDNSTNWNTAFNDSITSAAVTGTGTKTLTLTQQDAGTITASWTDLGLTSVGISMPSAFNVANSPLTANGTIAITGAGNASQYIRGDGTLAVLPPSGGGGGGASVSYYLNGSVNQGTFAGNTYYQMNKVPVIGAGTDFSTNTNGYISQFITNVGDPAFLNIPAGNWNLEMYFSSSSAGGTPSFYVELYKYDGVVFTLISSNSTSPESITGGTSIDLYVSALAVPSTSLTLTDRLAIRVYVNTSGRTITLHTEDNHLCQVITTFTTGLTALNGLTAQVQNLTTGTSGTNFNIVSLGDTHTFNLPVASATNTGKLSSTDWSTFNSKQGAITLTTTGSSGAATLVGTTLNIPNYGSALSGYLPLTGGTLTGELAIKTNTDTGLNIISSTGTQGLWVRAGYDTDGTAIPVVSANNIQFQSSGTVAGTFSFVVGNTKSIFIQNNGAATFFNNITGTSAIFNGFAIGATPISSGTATSYTRYLNTGADLYIGIENSTGAFFGASAYANVMYMGSTNFEMFFSGAKRLTITNAGAATFVGAITASNFSGSSSGINTGDQTLAGLGGVGGTGTINTVPKFTAASTIASSNIYINGNFVGINQSSPAAPYALDVHAANSTYNLRLFQPLTATDSYNTIYITGNQTTVAAYFGIGGSTTGNTSFRDVAVIGTQSAHDLVFNTSDAKKMTLFTTGNLLIGTSSTDAGFKLEVNGTSRFTNQLNIRYDSAVLNLRNTLNSSFCNLQLANDVSANLGGLALFGSTYVSANQYRQNGTYVYSGGAGGLTLHAEGAYSLFLATNAVTALTINSSQVATFSNSVTTNNTITTNKAKAGSGVETNSFLDLIQTGSHAIGDSLLIRFGAGGVAYTAQIAGILGADNVAYGSLAFSTRNYFTDSMVEMMRITNRSTILINTTSGVSGGGTLQVNGNVNINGVFQINGTTIGGGGGSGVTGSGTTNYIPKWSSGTSLGDSAMLQDTGGIQYFGGSSSTGSATASPKYFRFNNDYSSGYTDASLKIYLFNEGATRQGLTSGPAYDMQYHSSGSSTGRHAFYVDNNEVIRFNQSNVLIGTTTDAGGTYRLQVNGSISMAYASFFNFRGSSGAGDVLVDNSGSTLRVTGNFLVNGTVTSSGGFFDTSDARLKTLITDNYKAKGIENVSAKLYIKNGKEELGYYAQDLQKILPSAVSEGVDGFLTLSYSQVHTAKIAVIEDEVTILKNRVSDLETKLQKYEA